MDFIKMHGLGNDFIIIEASQWDEADKFQSYASFLCDRNIGIGADGLVITGNDDKENIFMRIFNPDGSEPEMCGNAIRCVAKYAWENGLVKDSNISVKTLAGCKYADIIFENDLLKSVRVDMGEPILNLSEIPMIATNSNLAVKMEAAGQEFEITGVSMGNPHCIIFVKEVETIPVSEWGPEIEKHRFFPARTNVEFVEIMGKNELKMRVWERGAGITMACGTGSCATLVASVLNRKTERQAVIHLLGGDLLIEWNENNNHVYMTGPATEVFKGSIDLG